MNLFVLLVSFMAMSTKAMGNLLQTNLEESNGYEQSWNILKNLESTYPNLLTISKAEDVYEKKYPGKLFNNPDMMCGEQRCETPIIRMTAKGDENQKITNKPQILVLGSFNGKDREAVNAVLNYIKVMCTTYEKFPVITHILRTRDIWLLPFPNSWGYFHFNNTELGIDPHYDFPYKVASGECFRTKTARIINEVVSENLFQVAINFKFGSSAISYSWGSPNHQPCGQLNQEMCDLDSPDLISQQAIANAMSNAAGSDGSARVYMDVKRRYISGQNEKGAFEDWIYAASWDNSSVPDKCYADKEYPSKLRSYPGGFSNRASSFSIVWDEVKISVRMLIPQTFSNFFQKWDGDSDGVRAIRAIHKAVELAKPEIVHQIKPRLFATNENKARLKADLLPIGCLHIDNLVAVVREGENCDGAKHRIPVFTSSRKCRSIAPWDQWHTSESKKWQRTGDDAIYVDIYIPTKSYASCISFEYSFDSSWKSKAHKEAALEPKSLLVLTRSSTYLDATAPNAILIGHAHTNERGSTGVFYEAKYCHTDADGDSPVPPIVREHTEAAKRQSFEPGTFSSNLIIAPVCVIREVDDGA